MVVSGVAIEARAILFDSPFRGGCRPGDRSGIRHRQAQEVHCFNDSCERTPWLDRQPGLCASDTSFPDDSHQLGGPAGYDRGVTDETISRVCNDGRVDEAVEALGVLVQTDRCVSICLLYAVLKRCVLKKDLVLSRRVHALAVRKGYQSDTFLGFHILRMYASHGRVQDAMDVFQGVAKPDNFTWTAIISAHVRHGKESEAVHLYHRMRRSSVKPDGHVFVAALQACARAADLKTGQLVHADILATGCHPGLFVCNCLVNMYAKCGSLEDAQRVFDGLAVKDVVTWNALMAGYSQQGKGLEALRLYSAMQREGIVMPDSVTFVCLLQACSSVGNPGLEKGKQLHAQIRAGGHQADVLVGNSLVNMYAKCGSLEDAQRVFDGLSQKDVVTWNAMIAAYSQLGKGQEALHIYSAMQDDGLTVPDVVTYVCLLQACAGVGTPALEMGKQLHAQLRQEGHQGDVFVASSLVNMYAKCGSLADAQGVFDTLSQKDVVTWNAMITGYAQQGMGQEALQLYSGMREVGLVKPTSVTFICLLQACASVGTAALEMGKQLHAQVREQGHDGDVFISSCLVNMYAKCGSLEDAQRVFDGLGQKNVVTWTSMIAGYSQQGMGQEALQLYSAMQKKGIGVNDPVTLLCLLQACASVGTPALEMGRELHAQIREQGHETDGFIASSLVNMYSKCGSLEDAQRVFDGLGQKDAVTWNAMIGGYSQHGMGQEAFRLYRVMQREGTAVADSITFVCLLQACANVAALHLGRQLHAQIREQELQADMFIAGSLIHMYGQAGSMIDAQLVFDALPEKDVVTWTALIAGYTSQGDSEMVFNLVHRMREDGIRPVGITFLCVLSVCSHAGLVHKGRQYFEDMSRQHGITPTVEHYSCMVDLLGRAGLLDEALSLVKSLPVLCNASMWHTLLAACRKWSNVEVGNHAFNEAVKLDSRDAAAYVIMSNIYTSAHMWEEAQEIQAKRTIIGAWKQPGQSWWTDEDGLVHSFLVGDEKHPQSEAKPRQVSCKIPIAGYAPYLDSNFSDENKNISLVTARSQLSYSLTARTCQNRIQHTNGRGPTLHQQMHVKIWSPKWKLDPTPLTVATCTAFFHRPNPPDRFNCDRLIQVTVLAKRLCGPTTVRFVNNN